MLDCKASLSILNKCFPDGTIISVESVKALASLWAGMGHVLEVKAQGKNGNVTVIIKHISMPTEDQSIGNMRKSASYAVEASFYQIFSVIIREFLQVNITPRCYYVDMSGQSRNEVVICMSPLPGPVITRMREAEYTSAIRSIAMFHSCFWGTRADEAVAGGLQSQGGYWYLDTRPDEFEAMPRKGWKGRLRKAAVALDVRLKQDPCQCVIHGDLKGSNMSYSVSDDTVTFCDFQYSGKSSPMKDMAYFLAVTAPHTTPQSEQEALSLYLCVLQEHLYQHGSYSNATVGPIETVTVPSLPELQIALNIAYADLYRWMVGWGCWGDTALREAKTKAVLDMLDGGKELSSSEAYCAAMLSAFPV